MKILTTIHPDGTVTSVNCRARPTLYELQEAVGGGYIETIPHWTRHNGRRCTAYADEDGIHKGLPFNAIATMAWMTNLGSGPFSYEPRLYGPVCVVTIDKDE